MHKVVGEDEHTQRQRLRKVLRQRRAEVPAVDLRAASRLACAAVASFTPFLQAARVGLYAAFDGEIDPIDLADVLLARGAIVAYPRVLPGTELRLEFFSVTSTAQLRPGSFGIYEPPAEAPSVALETLEVILVPGIAFARDGHRLGFGRGFYDATLAAAPAPVRLGLCHPFQLFDRLPSRTGDEPVDFIFTPRERVATGARPLAPKEVPA